MTRTRFLLGVAALASASPALAQQSYPWGGEAKPAQQPAPAPAPTTPPQAMVAPAPRLEPVAPLPTLSQGQEATLQAWLATGAAHGVAGRGDKASELTGEALAAAVLDRARALRIGRLDRQDFIEDWAMRPASWDPRPSFVEAVSRDRLQAWLSDLTPPYAGYDGLRKGLAAYRAMQAAGGWKAIPAGPEIGLGASGARVAALRARLRVEDPTVAATGNYDAALRDAVQRAQRRFGLNPTGNLGAQTLAALNVPVSARIDSIVANMERWRWLPRELPTHRVQVNIVAGLLTVFEGDKPVTSMRAVTGAPDSATPMLTSKIHSIVINPPWNVPAGIAQRELFPKGEAALKAQGFRIITGADGSKRLQQAAGPQSALGRYKFDFDNPFAVYLHDTPSKGTFARFDRLASHGCVRVERPAELAQLMLRADPKWGASAIQAAVETGKTQRVALPEQVSVYLLYWTSFASANGAMNFRDDPYNWDKQLATKVLAAAERRLSQLAQLGIK